MGVFIERDADGKILNRFAVQQEEGQEFLDDNAPELVALVEAEKNPVPKQVTAAQLIRALDKMGLLDAVQNAAAKAGGLTLALWQHAPFFHRDDPLISEVAAGIGKSDADVDGLFRLADSF